MRWRDSLQFYRIPSVSLLSVNQKFLISQLHSPLFLSVQNSSESLSMEDNLPFSTLFSTLVFSSSVSNVLCFIFIGLQFKFLASLWHRFCINFTSKKFVVTHLTQFFINDFAKSFSTLSKKSFVANFTCFCSFHWPIFIIVTYFIFYYIVFSR